MGEAEVGDDYKDDSIDVHDVLLVIAITCFEIDQPKNQGKKLKQYINMMQLLHVGYYVK